MKVRKAKRTIASSQFKPTVGYSPASIIPAAPAGGGTNAAAMRATFSFLPTNADELNKRIYTAKTKWLSLNPSKTEDDFPGIPDLYGTGSIIGAGNAGKAQNAIDDKNAMCAKQGGRIWVESSQQCECNSNQWAKSRDSPCQDYSF